MKSILRIHPKLEDLEYYSRNHQRDDSLIEKVEEHLLVCQCCRVRLDKREQENRVLKIVLRELDAGAFIH